jgi:hypothetical protein
LAGTDEVAAAMLPGEAGTLPPDTVADIPLEAAVAAGGSQRERFAPSDPVSPESKRLL